MNWEYFLILCMSLARENLRLFDKQFFKEKLMDHYGFRLGDTQKWKKVRLMYGFSYIANYAWVSSKLQELCQCFLITLFKTAWNEGRIHNQLELKNLLFCYSWPVKLQVFFSQYHPKRFGVDQVMFGLKLNNQEKWKPQAINFSPDMLKNTLFYYKLLQLMLTSPSRLSINENRIRYYWKLKHFKRSISFFYFNRKSNTV